MNEVQTPASTNRLQSFINTAALLVVGGALGAATVAYFSNGQSSGQWGTLVNASASQGEDNFSIATGLVEQDLEGFFFLDFITGDLRGAILSRRSGKFTGFFEYNVQADFGTQTQNPKYLMVTGLADLPRGKGPSQLARCVVYVAEATSGQVFAYALPYSGSLNAKGAPQNGSFIMVDGGPFRTTFVRGQ